MGCKPSKTQIIPSSSVNYNGIKVQVIDLTAVASKQQKKLRHGKNKKIFEKAEALQAEYMKFKEEEKEENQISKDGIIVQQPMSAAAEKVIVEMIEKFREVYEGWGSMVTMGLGMAMGEATMSCLQNYMDATEVARDNLYEAKEVLKMVNNENIDVLRDHLMTQYLRCSKMEAKSINSFGYTQMVYCNAKDAYWKAYTEISRVKKNGEDVNDESDEHSITV